ncbi:MAG: Ig-like domain-containing protein [Chloroflexia bacterium]
MGRIRPLLLLACVLFGTVAPLPGRASNLPPARQMYPYVPIPEIQYTTDPGDGTFPSPYVDQTVRTSGVVVAVYPRYYGGAYILEDPQGGPWSGIMVFDSCHQPQVGDAIEMVARVQEYYGFTELVAIRAYTRTGSLPLPPPVVTDTAHLATAHAAWAEQLEGVLVRVEWATVTHANLGYGEWGITDASGVEARVDDVADYGYRPTLGDVLRAITGTLWYSFDNYKLEPRGDADILLHDDVPPSVLSTVPAPGASGVSLYEPLRAVFSERIVPETLDFSLCGPSGVVSGTVTYEPGMLRAAFAPAHFLSPYSAYTATIAGTLEDLYGNPMGVDYTWSFTTGAPDTTPPLVVSVSPAPGATGVSIYATLLITFNEAMDPASINENTIRLTRSGQPVQGRVTYDVVARRAVFVPASLLQENALYQALVSSGVRDRAGNPMGFDYPWTFRTGPAPVFHCYHGDLHNHTSYSDGSGTPAEALAVGRANGLDFMALTDHSYALDDVEWEATLEAVNAATVPGEFVALRGAEWTQGSQGHINVYNTVRHPMRSDMGYAYGDYVPGLEDGATVIGFYTWLVHTGTVAVDETGTFAQFNHPGWLNFDDWAFHPEALEMIPLAEMGNGYGASYTWSEEQSIRALDYGWHVAPTDNADMHISEWGAHPMRTGIWATALTKVGVMEALRARRTFASEDVNYELAFKANGYWMGSVIPNAGTLAFDISGYDPDDGGSALVEVVGDTGRVVVSATVGSDFRWTPSLPVPPGVQYYYVRVTQSDGDRIASAPIWTQGTDDIAVTDFTVQPSIPTTATASLLSARVTNRGITDVHGIVVSFAADGVPIGGATVDVLRNGDAFAYVSWRPTEVGPTRLTVSISNVPAGDNPLDNEAEKWVEVTDRPVPLVLIDAGHKNNNAGSPMARMIADLSAHRYNVLLNLDEITPEDLESVRLLIVTDPGDDVEDLFTVTETRTIAEYVASGGSLWMAGQADYRNQGNSDELNSILAAIEAVTGEPIPFRLNDDEVIDGDDNNGYPWGVTWHTFLTDTAFSTGIGVNVTATASWSEASLMDRNRDALTPEDGAWIVATGDLDPGETCGPYGCRPNRTYNEDATGDCFEDHDLAYIYPLTGTIPVPLAAVYELSAGGRIALWGDSNDTFSTYGYTSGDHKQNELLNLELVMWLLREPLQHWSIAQARTDLNADDVPDFRGRLVWVEGTVTAGFGEFFDVLYVQDETGGITVYAPAGDIEGTFERGTIVRVVATVDVYQGDTELQFSEAEQIRVLGSGSAPDPRVLSTGEAAREESEGWLLQTEGLVTRWVDPNSFIINDGTGPCRVFLDGYNDDPEDPTFASIRPGDWVRVVGLGSEDLAGQRVRVRAESDILPLRRGSAIFLPLIARR